MGTSAVFALCARSCATHLPGVLSNLDRLAGLYERSGFVFVEGDSVDDSRAIVKAWAAERPGATVIELDGLDASHPRRTDRMAFCRNAYIDFIKSSPLAAYDQLVMLDADDINRPPIDLAGFTRARDWLVDHDAAAVFANSLPFYYDIYALRHPSWCPRDMMSDIRGRPEDMDRDAARQRFVRDRQIPILTTAPPIEVQSAFGGLAIYRMADAMAGARYFGFKTNSGREVCEHVSFNHRVANGGRRLFILPWMTVGKRKIAIYSQESRTVALQQGGRSFELTTAPDADPAEARSDGPWFPALARLIGKAAPGTLAIDAGAGVGEAIARCQLEGTDLRFIAVEATLSRYKYLKINCLHAPNVLADVETAWTRVAPAEDAATQDLGSVPNTTLRELAAPHGALSLVKLAADGNEPEILRTELAFLEQVKPAIWADVTLSRPEDVAAWISLLEQAGAAWPYLAAFDHQDHAVLAGELAQEQQALVELLESAKGPALHLALIPERFAHTLAGWLEIPERGRGSAHDRPAVVSSPERR